MPYKSEELISELKRARADAALSQRDLSVASGLTQSHISQIERGTLEPGLSSLIDLARALQHEVVIVPKKLLPAVRAVIQGAAPTQAPMPTDKQIAAISKFQRLLKKLRLGHGSSSDLDQIDDSLGALQRSAIANEDVAALARLHDDLKRASTRPGETLTAIREAARQLRSLSSQAARARGSDEPRPAYSFDNGDDDA